MEKQGFQSRPRVRILLLLAYGVSVLLLSTTLFLGADQLWTTYQAYGPVYEVRTIIAGVETVKTVSIYETAAAMVFISWLDLLALLSLRMIWTRSPE